MNQTNSNYKINLLNGLLYSKFIIARTTEQLFAHLVLVR